MPCRQPVEENVRGLWFCGARRLDIGKRCQPRRISSLSRAKVNLGNEGKPWQKCLTFSLRGPHQPHAEKSDHVAITCHNPFETPRRAFIAFSAPGVRLGATLPVTPGPPQKRTGILRDRSEAHETWLEAD